MSLHADSAPGDIAPVRSALRGQYEIQRELGRGGMGIVLLARELLRNPRWPLAAAHTLGATITWPPQYERARAR
jgi:2,4-dienoyl-CoA reductase-like NADH-dependent reductase (Old Yellow Enzyme family)